MKVLIVDPDTMRAAALQLALATHGIEVTVATSGSFALTMLDWNRHEIVTSRARIDDMDGHELCAILKSDPSTRDVRFVLIAGPGEVTAAQTTAASVDLVLPPTLETGAVVPLVMRLINGDTAPAPAPPAPAPPPPPPVTPAPPPVVAPRPYAPPRPVPPPVTAPAAAPATRPSAAPAPATPAPKPPVAPPAPPKPAAPAKPIAPAPATPVAAPSPVAAPASVAPAAVSAPPAAAPATPRTETVVAPDAPARPEPAPAVPKLRPDPVATPTAEPPKRYVTAAAAAAAAPWTKQPPANRAPAAAPPAAPPAINLEQMPSGTFQGSLEVMDLAELTQALAVGGKNGRLILALPQGGGLIAFESGRVVHAEYRGATGEAAFAALLTAAHTGGAGRFCFLPSAAGESPSPSRTIDKSVDRLLLSIATAIDEKG